MEGTSVGRWRSRPGMPFANRVLRRSAELGCIILVLWNSSLELNCFFFLCRKNLLAFLWLSWKLRDLVV